MPLTGFLNSICHSFSSGIAFGGTQHNEWMAGSWPMEQQGRGTVVSARVKLPTAMAFIAEETLKSSMFEAQMRKVAPWRKWKNENRW